MKKVLVIAGPTGCGKTDLSVKIAKKIGITAAIAGIALAPFTGGASLGVTAMGLTVGTLTISTAELIAILAFSIGMTAILKGYKNIKIGPNGDVTLSKD